MSVATAPGRPSRLRAVMALVGVVALAWVGAQLVASRDSLAEVVSRIDPTILAAAVAASALGLLLGAFTWWWMMRRLGFTAPLLATLDVWLTSNLWKYLPGQLWMPVGRVVGAPRAGAPRGVTFVVTAVEQAASLGAAAVVLSAAALPAGLAIAVALTPIALAMSPLAALTAPLARRFGSEWPERLADRPLLVGLYAAALANAALGVVAFSSVLAAVGVFRFDALAGYAAAWTAAFLAGYLAIGAPAGLGVREAVLFGLLRDAGVGTGAAAEAALLSRCVAVAAELSCFAAVAALERRSRPRS